MRYGLCRRIENGGPPVSDKSRRPSGRPIERAAMTGRVSGNEQHDDPWGRPYTDRVYAAVGHRLFCLPGLTSWAGATGIYCLHAAAYDGTDWAVTFQEQDVLAYRRRCLDDGITDLGAAARDEHRCRYLPGVTVGHVVNAADGSPRAFTETEAATLFALLSRALFIAATISGDQPLVLMPPLLVPAPDTDIVSEVGPAAELDLLQLAAIAPERRAETLAETMERLTADDIGDFLDSFMQQ